MNGTVGKHRCLQSAFSCGFMLSCLCILMPKFAAPNMVTESVAVLIREAISSISGYILSCTFTSFSITNDGDDALQ